MDIYYIPKINRIIYFPGNATKNNFKDEEFKISVKSVVTKDE